MINSHLLSADDQLVKSQLFLTGSNPVRLLPTLPLSYWADTATCTLARYSSMHIEPYDFTRVLFHWAEKGVRVRIPLSGVGSSNLSTSGVTGRRSTQKTACSQSKHAPRPRYTLSNWSTRLSYLARDFKSLVSLIWSRRVRISRRSHDHRSHSPGLYTGFSSRQQGYQQKAVKNSNNPRINGTALRQLFTHKRNRFESKARINGTAFTHKRNRQCGSRLRSNWSTANPPVSTSITNNPIVKSKTYIGYAKIRINSYE